MTTNADAKDWGGITFGSFIIGNEDMRASDDNNWFQHEFGHYLQSQEHGLFWLFDNAIESGISALVNDTKEHDAFYTEQDANARSLMYFAKYYGESYATRIWDFRFNPITGYDPSKTYSENLSIIKQAIFRLIFSIHKKGQEDSIIEDSISDSIISISDSIIKEEHDEITELDAIIF